MVSSRSDISLSLLNSTLINVVILWDIFSGCSAIVTQLWWWHKFPLKASQQCFCTCLIQQQSRFILDAQKVARINLWPHLAFQILIYFFLQSKCLQKGCVSLFRQMMNNVEFEHERQGRIVNSSEQLYANKWASHEHAYHIQMDLVQFL